MRKKKSILDIIGIVFCIIMMLIVMFPYANMVLSSFKPSLDVISTSPTFFPRKWVVENYIEAFRNSALPKIFSNSFVSSTVSCALAMMIGSMAAYAISRLSKHKVSGAFMHLTLFMRIVPLISIAIPMFDISLTLNLYDSVLLLVLFYTAFQTPFVIWVMKSFFDGLPVEVEEAAMVDGCNTFQTFFRICLPMASTGLASTAILSFIMPWNDFQFALFTTSSNAKTLPIALSELVTAFEISLAPMTAIATAFSIPLIIIAIFLQKYIIGGITGGAVKE